MKQFKSPAHKLIAFFEKSRDGWKKRSENYKARLESIRSKVRSLERSRDNWKEKYQQLAEQKDLEKVNGAGTAAGGTLTSTVISAGAAKSASSLEVIKKQLEETRKEKEKYKDELAELSMRELKNQKIVAESKQMRQIMRTALKLAHMEVTDILLLGESGTGKGLLAKFIHNSGKRKKKPFIQINCAALPESLLEAELFGYEKGAFSGASEHGKPGLFELADEGTDRADQRVLGCREIQVNQTRHIGDHHGRPESLGEIIEADDDGEHAQFRPGDRHGRKHQVGSRQQDRRRHDASPHTVAQ